MLGHGKQLYVCTCTLHVHVYMWTCNNICLQYGQGHNFIMYGSARTMYFCVYGITCKYYIIHCRSYWNRSWPFNNENFSSLMSSRRFELILKFLHLNDSETQPQKGEPVLVPAGQLVHENCPSGSRRYPSLSLFPRANAQTV